jgi:hypothetical protein
MRYPAVEVEMSEAVTFSSKPRVVVTELGDGSGVLLDLDSFFYFTLNASALVVWRGLEKGAHTVDALAERVAAQFEVELPRARLDVESVIQQLLSDQLVRRTQ